MTTDPIGKPGYAALRHEDGTLAGSPVPGQWTLRFTGPLPLARSTLTFVPDDGTSDHVFTVAKKGLHSMVGVVDDADIWSNPMNMVLSVGDTVTVDWGPVTEKGRSHELLHGAADQ